VRKGRHPSPGFREVASRLRAVAREAVAAFLRNNGFQTASSLAFTTSLALVPSLLLLTSLLGLGIGSSHAATEKTALFVAMVLPQSGDVILREVASLARHAAITGFLNGLLLLWSIVPLVGTMRVAVAAIFRTVRPRSLWLDTAIDVLIGALFVTGVAAVAAVGVALRVVGLGPARLSVPGWLGLGVPFVLSVALLSFLYVVLAPRVRPAHLLAGAVLASVLWFAMRPAFALFLAYNPGYGFAFGSFKSLFLVMLWVYYSQAVFLLGAEVIAALHRMDAIVIRRLILGMPGVSAAERLQFVVTAPEGHVFFREGDEGHEAYYVLRGSVRVEKDDREVSVIGPGRFFGEMSFLLGRRRTAGAVAHEECECISINDRNVTTLMREFPETVREMLVEMASRLEKTTGHLAG
jgi:membrane protein